MHIEHQERTEATILHADLDSFYASVEQRDHPWLRRRPVLVGSGVVLAASYEAKTRGVRSPMPHREALALCPTATTMPPRFDAYMEASRCVFEIFRDISPLVEGLSVDEAFLDVGGLHRIDGTPAQIGQRLRERVRREVGLPITVGVARSKFLAKVASAVGKPDGLLVVEPGSELQFLHPLPVRRLWGVGPKTEARLHEAGITTVGQMAALGEQRLAKLLGRGTGRHLFALSMAHDPRRIDTGRRRKSIGAQRALGRRITSENEIEGTALAIIDRLGERLRAAGRVTRTVELRLRFDDFTSITRSRSLREPTDHTEVVLATARALLDEAMPLIRERGCTLIGLSLANLENHGAVQLTLPFDGGEHDADLDLAMDALRTRFGRAAVTRGSLLHRPLGPDAPMLTEQD
ncbi:DNA polymerase IV OS=Tsukamurella paurometabola (strain ATCC 8368 / DSM / CCUG 35730 / CIP 100753/ JCM 10117 / KCTC 9821 / NBRC 16120 / NCIMB 702349 /NCTC 13040) OX=521096 GN=dinB PE=3 SV=1 [Tsukamurella paurometabola]|uniref:DNA polymerase IV n=1 Tax=Tsukamurella paurometabola (strain ATCC 8368 / DSM 20162 / CCUG 35730 / CIP 100753 / JCM 10117 / KCTC 9821 / NBRC 16120 / NCIMB 702349 / NCTC 13040) TaxID=521096 RepID=D5UXV0_TSUPD|nr:DNA polymerase IV [Tsukamurella paurometabola]ADG80187.1 DNA-directed DNA polymerase [Tsukamurella paurometabola DSM 20162]SUP38760.1 DNA polymerase IV [Tsukamurella paurometabola]